MASCLGRGTWVGLILSVLLLLSGCAYPKELRKENQINPAEFITVVQQAVDLYHQKHGVLPIKNSDMSTPLYEKYVIDFAKLTKANYLSAVPANAFESGGIFLYVLVDPETKPTVKLMDLSAYQSVDDVQKKINDYKVSHNGNLPAGIAINEAFDYVDFDKLGMKAPEIKSVYNRQNLITYLVNKQTGDVSIDYAMDIHKLIQDKSLAGTLKAEQDLRELLVNQTLFVPIRSVPYRWQNSQPLPQVTP
ncbi:DUF3939 domain-containing protein [Paenibacillus sp. GCM10023248]|uniref:DUF3939 domain-containing protein n=1 Tax=unclassified Paenibacillus TaxID=185978 RepID=UPI002377FCBC|nr:DUF3939 domain-containing protein [Paenibacillus sp. MAHUQ-63]MDD9267629.1 DUF3939 domain-containing protein [Paenibacillus sp. MAHUQ-63]